MKDKVYKQCVACQKTTWHARRGKLDECERCGRKSARLENKNVSKIPGL